MRLLELSAFLLLMIENAGQWLEDGNGPHAHLREVFIAVNIEVDDEFPQWIASAVRGYPHPVDCVITISDVRLPGVAKLSRFWACQLLRMMRMQLRVTRLRQECWSLPRMKFSLCPVQKTCRDI
jgi:ATP-grasp N-terminal domain